jgi:6-pyruvoyltetrahydropterin/6-carboxytetrahydropterin synthase
MFEVSVEQSFAAGHALRNYKGKCENVHGHNYRVQLRVIGTQLDAAGLLMDFGDMKRILREVIAILDHQFINDIEPFTTVNPTAENLTKWFYDEVTRRLPEGNHLSLGEVKVWETDIQYAAYRPA